MKLQEQNLFATPKDWDDLMARLDLHTGSEKTAAIVSAMMAWNLACQIVNKETAA